MKTVAKIAILSGFVSFITSCEGKTQRESEAIGMATTPTFSDPPDCECCVFDETKNLDYLLKIAADTTKGQRIVISGTVYKSDAKTPADLNNIDPKTKSTLIVYNNRIVLDKFVDFVPSDKNFTLLFKSVDAAEKSTKEPPKK